ncbi:MAG: HAD family hydrolase [Butyrivibrio sp.]|jgi:putative hydrolase of the HAD superfamily|nr:HAD family hydrolase [Butyrivibrio sp.]
MGKYYKNYIFDLYGTLVDIHTDENRPDFWNKMASLLSCYGADYSPEKMQQSYFDIVHEEEQNLAFESGMNFPEIRIERVFARLLKEAPAYHSCSEKIVTLSIEEIEKSEWVRMISNVFRVMSRQKLEAYPHTLQTLEALRTEGSHIYLLSNAQRLFTDAEIESTGVREYLEAIYISSDAGMKKPQPEFMMKLLEEQNLDPQDTVMVGNDFQSDIGVAVACGIPGIFLNTDQLSSIEMRARLARVLNGKNDHYRPVIISSGDIEELLDLDRDLKQ